MYSFVYFPLLSSIAGLVLSGLCLNTPVKPYRNPLLFWSIILTLWNAGITLFCSVDSVISATWVGYFTQIVVVFIPSVFFHQTLYIIKKDFPRLRKACYIISTLFAISILTTPYYFQGVTKLDLFWVCNAGPLFVLFSFAFYPTVLLPSVILHIKASSSPKMLSLAAVLLVACGLNDLALVMGFRYYFSSTVPVVPLASIIAIFYSLTACHSVLNAQIMETKLRIGQQVAHILRICFVTTLSIIALLLVNLVSPNLISLSTLIITPTFIILALLLGKWMYPRILDDTSTNISQLLMGDRFCYDSQLLEKSRQFSSLLSVEALGTAVVELMTKYLHPSYVKLQLTSGAANRVLFDHSTLPQLSIVMPQSRTEPYAKLDTFGRQHLFNIGQEGKFGYLVLHFPLSSSLSALDISVLTDVCQQIEKNIILIDSHKRNIEAERHRLMSEMSRALAHDLNNLTTSISTYLQLTDSIHTDPDLNGLHDLAASNLSTIQNYIKEAMFFAHSGELKKSPLRPEYILQNVLTNVHARASNKHVTVSVKAISSADLPADATLLERALTNLVANAIDASESGQAVEVSVQYSPTPGPKITIEVTDTGSGIEPKNISRLFQPYFTTKDTGSTNRGFGLGLSITKKIIDLHGGSISVRNNTPKGTVFSVELPTIS